MPATVRDPLEVAHRRGADEMHEETPMNEQPDGPPSDEYMRSTWIAALSTPDPDNFWEGLPEAEAAEIWEAWLTAHDAEVAKRTVQPAM